MSIEDEITDRTQRGMLYPLLPKAASAPVRRALFVDEWLWRELQSRGEDDWSIRIAKLRADLEVFVTELTITPKYLFLLYPAADAVWEIRSTRDDPSIRVMGLFAAKDVLIITNYARRDVLEKWQSREWKEAKRMAHAMWRRMFMTYVPIITSDVKEVCSGATDEVFYKERRA